MISSLAVLVGVLQVGGHPLPARSTRAPDPVRVWRADSTVHVTLREPGHLLLLHVDAIGRIRVLFPLTPADSTAVSADAPIVVALPPVAQGNPATFVAVRSRWAFELTVLQSGSTWNYDALLLQPTAGDPFAALLDIADRVTDGRPYDYGVGTYSRSGTLAERGPPVQPQVCLSCVRRGPAVAVAAASIPTNAVDCSNASLTNSFCGVNSGSVSIASAPTPQVVYQPAAAAAPAPVYVPYFMPMSHGFRPRFEHSPPPPPAAIVQRSQGVAYPIAPRLLVPSTSQLRSVGTRRP